MHSINRTTESFNSTPLFQAAREREFRSLTYAERKLAKELGVELHVARLLATQAYGSGGWRR